MLEEQLTKALLRTGSEAPFMLALDGAHVISCGDPCKRRWTTWRSSRGNRRCRPGARYDGGRSRRFTARINVDLLIPSQRAAALVESAGFICFQPEQTRQPAQTCAWSEGWRYAARRRSSSGCWERAAAAPKSTMPERTSSLRLRSMVFMPSL